MSPAPCHIVVGKGGVGRSTVSAAYAVALSHEAPVTLLRTSPLDVRGGLPSRVREVRAEPRELFDDVVRKGLRLGPLARRVTNHPLYEALVDIMPGVREAALLHHAISLAEKQGRPVIVDAPATGHALHILRAPEQLADILTGKAQRALQDISHALRDPDRVQLLPVTLPEELPVQETTELLDALPGMGLHTRGIVVNRMPPPMHEVPEEVWPDSAQQVTHPQALTLLHAWRRDADRWVGQVEGLGPDVLILPHVVQPRDIVTTLATHMERWAA